MSGHLFRALVIVVLLTLLPLATPLPPEEGATAAHEDVVRIVAGRMRDPDLSSGVDIIANRFRSIGAEGPACVAAFLPPTDQDMREWVTADAFAVMDSFLKALRT